MNESYSGQTEMILSVQTVSKKFSKNLRSSLWHGIRDLAGEFFVRRSQLTATGDLRKNEFWALRNVSFELRRGEALAIMGDNGAGKSTLLKLIYGLIRPDGGQIYRKGNLEAIIELHSGLNPILTGRENIFLKSAYYGLNRKQTEAAIEKIIEFAEIADFIDSPIQFYSSGMLSRLGYAISAHLSTDIFLVDEVLAVGDINFQRKCINHMLEYIAAGGSLIFISHSPHHIQSVCNRGILLEKGEILFDGDVADALNMYLGRNKVTASGDRNRPIPVELSENQPVVITTALIEPLEGTDIVSGESVRIVVNYNSLQTVENIFWGFSIWTSDNSICVTGNINVTAGTLNKGEDRLKCIIDDLPLFSGMYLLKVAIIEASSFHGLATLGWVDEPITFTVQTPSDLLNNTLKSFNQLVKINVEWK